MNADESHDERGRGEGEPMVPPAMASTPKRKAAEWAKELGTPPWLLAAAKTVARVRGIDWDCADVTRDEFTAAVERER